MSDENLQRKALVLLASIPESDASQLLSQFSDGELEQLAEVARRGIEPTSIEQEELAGDLTARRQMAWISDDVAAHDAEHDSVFTSELQEYSSTVVTSEEVIREKFAGLEGESPERLRSLLAQERPQTIALVLAFLPPVTSAAVLGALPTELQVAASLRLARLEPVDLETACAVADVLRQRLRRRERPLAPEVGGPRHLARILQATDEATERALLENLTHEDRSLVVELQKHLVLMRQLRCRRSA